MLAFRGWNLRDPGCSWCGELVLTEGWLGAARRCEVRVENSGEGRFEGRACKVGWACGMVSGC